MVMAAAGRYSDLASTQILLLYYIDLYLNVHCKDKSNNLEKMSWEK